MHILRFSPCGSLCFYWACIIAIALLFVVRKRWHSKEVGHLSHLRVILCRYPHTPHFAQAESAAGACAMPPFAVSRSVAGNAWPTESMTCAIWSNGTRLLMPARASCAELKAAATPMALRFWQGTSTRPPTGSQTRPSRLLSAMELASSACSGVPRASAPARRLPWRRRFRPRLGSRPRRRQRRRLW